MNRKDAHRIAKARSELQGHEANCMFVMRGCATSRRARSELHKCEVIRKVRSVYQVRARLFCVPQGRAATLRSSQSITWRILRHAEQPCADLMYAARFADDCAFMRFAACLLCSLRVLAARCTLLRSAVRPNGSLFTFTARCAPLRLATRHSVSLRLFLAGYTIMQLAARPCSFLCALTTRGESSRPAVRPLGSP